jgi:hypothetical protein
MRYRIFIDFLMIVQASEELRTYYLLRINAALLPFTLQYRSQLHARCILADNKELIGTILALYILLPSPRYHSVRLMYTGTLVESSTRYCTSGSLGQTCHMEAFRVAQKFISSANGFVSLCHIGFSTRRLYGRYKALSTLRYLLEANNRVDGA